MANPTPKRNANVPQAFSSTKTRRTSDQVLHTVVATHLLMEVHQDHAEQRQPAEYVERVQPLVVVGHGQGDPQRQPATGPPSLIGMIWSFGGSTIAPSARRWTTGNREPGTGEPRRKLKADS